MTVSPKIRGKRIVTTQLPPHPPNPLVLLHYARELLDADKKRQEAKLAAESADRRFRQLVDTLSEVVKEYE